MLSDRVLSATFGFERDRWDTLAERPHGGDRWAFCGLEGNVEEIAYHADMGIMSVKIIAVSVVGILAAPRLNR